MTEHGIGNAAIARKYSLGVVIKPLLGDERFTGMLSIPYLSRGGVKGIRYRNLSGNGGKFAQHEGQSVRLYNTNAYFAGSEIIGLAEGEIDAIAATEVLGVPTLGIPGATQWTGKARIWAPIFRDYQMVVFFADGDPVDKRTGLRPGRELARLVGESLKWRLKTIECPEGEDVSSMAAAGRASELLSKIPAIEDDNGNDD